MDLQPNPKLDEIYKLTLDNNKMLHKMRRVAVYKSVLSVIWWFIVIIVPALVYYVYLQPYVDQILLMNSKLPGFDQLQLPKGVFPDLTGFFNSVSNLVPTSTSSSTGN